MYQEKYTTQQLKINKKGIRSRSKTRKSNIFWHKLLSPIFFCLNDNNFYVIAPKIKIPKLLLYISSNCSIGKGFFPIPASIVKAGLL